MWLRGYKKGERFLDERIAAECTRELAELLGPIVQVLHVHHMLGWSESALDAILNLPVGRRVVSLHDFHMVCPSIVLLKDDESFCGVEPDRRKCNRCFRANWSAGEGTIEAYRLKYLNRLTAMDAVFVPSESVALYVKRAFPELWAEKRSKICIVENDLSYLFDVARKAIRADTVEAATATRKVAFVGALHRIKGRELIVRALDELWRKGVKTEIIGELVPAVRREGLDLAVHRYSDLDQFVRVLSESRPEIVATPSIVSESFGFAFYEGALLAPWAIPVVGPYGNPADVVKRSGIGVVMDSCTPHALVKAVEQALDHRAELLKIKAHWARQLLSTPNPFLEQYLTVTWEYAAQANRLHASSIAGIGRVRWREAGKRNAALARMLQRDVSSPAAGLLSGWLVPRILKTASIFRQDGWWGIARFAQTKFKAKIRRVLWR
jgi:glycosyltransferase involved in cell wall biosynthesis